MHRFSRQTFLVAFLVGTAASAQTAVTNSNDGATGTVPAYTGTAALGNSPIAVSGGNVGIGTTGPGYKLDVEGGQIYHTAAGESYIHNVAGGASDWIWGSSWAGGYTVGGTYISNGDPGTTSNIKFLISSGGKVGIGNVNPVYPLDVAGQIRSTSGGIVFPDNTTQSTAYIPNAPTVIASDPTIGTINASLNGTFVPVLNFTRWTGGGTVQDNASVGEFLNSALGEYDFGIGTGISSTGSQTATSTVVTVTLAGNVGIGTTNPGAALEVNGTGIKLTSGNGGAITFPNGSVQYVAWNGVLNGGDYAESVDVAGNRSNYEPGDVLMLDSGSSSDVVRSAEPYSTLVAGIYATKPGALGRRKTSDLKASTTEIPMAMVGIVPTKVSAENGPINKGDLLVSSSTPGYAMKGTDRNRMLGAVLGKAMGSLESGTGVIQVLVTLQ